MCWSIFTFLHNLGGFFFLSDQPQQATVVRGNAIKTRTNVSKSRWRCSSRALIRFVIFVDLDILCLHADFWNYKDCSKLKRFFLHDSDIRLYCQCVNGVFSFLSFTWSVLSLLWSHRKVLSEWLIRCFLFWRQCGLRRSSQCEKKKKPTHENKLCRCDGGINESRI